MVKKIIKKIKESAAKKKGAAAKKKTATIAKEKTPPKAKKATKKTLSGPRKRFFKKTDPNDLFALIEKEAYHLYEKRGSGHGSDQHDWYLAEKKVRTSIKK